jgi:hypothetical protein
MVDPCIGCDTTAMHPFEGLVRSIMDEGSYHAYCRPPLQSLQGTCEACKWRIIHRVIPEYCPQCGRPTLVLLLEPY